MFVAASSINEAFRMLRRAAQQSFDMVSAASEYSRVAQFWLWGRLKKLSSILSGHA